MAAPTLLDLPMEVRMLLWRCIIPAVEVEVVYAASSEPKWSPLFGPAELTILPPNPALPIMLICRQSMTDVLSMLTNLTAHIDSTIYNWWLDFTPRHYKRHFSNVSIRFERKGTSAVGLEHRRSDYDIKSDFEHYWEQVEILHSSTWTISHKPENPFSFRYIAEATVELRIARAIKAATNYGAELIDEQWDTGYLEHMDATDR